VAFHPRRCGGYLGIILTGLLILWLGVPYPDYVIGTLIGLYVIKEAVEILREARRDAHKKIDGLEEGCCSQRLQLSRFNDRRMFDL